MTCASCHARGAWCSTICEPPSTGKAKPPSFSAGERNVVEQTMDFVAQAPARSRHKNREGALELSGPLAGIRVIELGTLIAAPFASRMLAEFGAEIIKVEAPDDGDPLRK